MTTQQFLWHGWHWDWFALAIGAAILAGYGGLAGRRPGKEAAPGTGRNPRAWWFWLGLAVLAVALLSPVAILARMYLFSAHMLQHLLLLLVVPPLLLLSLGQFKDHRLRPLGGKWGRVLTAVPATWMAGVGAMWLWHVPLLCDAATTQPGIYRIQVVSLLLLGTLFWLPIAGPRAAQRLSPLAGIVYLVSACFACTLLGIYVTFAPVSVCSVYTHPMDPLGVLPLIRSRWGITAEIDQQLGGLLMWVPACLIYLSAVLGLLARWFGEEEAPDTAVARVQQ